MTYRLSDNLRSGHRAEDLAIVLLRQVGAVAQIPHPEDTGSDAIVTLLPRSQHNTRMLGSTLSFWVQIKTQSVDSISFDHEQARWLKELELPFFVARIASRETRLDLFSLHPLWDFYACGESYIETSGAPDKLMTLHLAQSPKPHSWNYLGPPFVSWSFHELEGIDQRTQRDKVVGILEEWCHRTQEARQLWQVGVNHRPKYTPGEFPEAWSAVKRFSNEPTALSRIALENIPQIEALLVGIQATGDLKTPDILIEAIQRACAGVSPKLTHRLTEMHGLLNQLQTAVRERGKQ